MQAVTQGGVLIIKEKKMGGCAFSAQEDSQAKLWHQRLGHPNAKALVHMAKEELVSGSPAKLKAFRRLKNKTCNHARALQAHRLPFPGQAPKRVAEPWTFST
jgi:hypothetical protein